MAEPIDNFSLPRNDWVDEEGRIYKDALIENFNAIEAKLQELQSLNVFEVTLPDASDIQIDEDVTLDSDDDKVVNLRSFLAITKLNNYPVECSFSGTKLTKLSWWNNNTYKTITNTETNCSTTNKFIYFDPNNSTITATSNTSPATNKILIGVYSGGQILGINSNNYLGVNLLQALSKMPIETQDQTKYANKGKTNYTNSGRSIGWAQTQSKSADGVRWGNFSTGQIDMTFKDTGRYYT